MDGEGGGDLRAGEHAPGELDGHLGLDGRLPADRGHRPAAAVHRRPQREQVEHGLDDEQVDAAVEQRLGLDLVGVAHLGVADLAERGELGAGADGARHPPGAGGGREVVGDPPGDRCAGGGQLVGAVGDPVLTERDGERSECVGLDDVDPGGEEGTVEVLDDVGAGDVQELVAPLEGGAAEVVSGEPGPLQRGAGGAVEDHHPVAHRLQVAHAVTAGTALTGLVQEGSLDGCQMATVVSRLAPVRALRAPRAGFPLRLSSVRHWHRSRRLPRLHRACPSTALDERVVGETLPREVPSSIRSQPARKAPSADVSQQPRW